MKILIRLAVSATALFAFTAPVLAQVGTNGGIVNSAHDMTAATGQLNSTATQVCVFCHTPHGSATGAPVPLWNKALPDGTGYTRYSSLNLPTFDSTEADVGSVSLACLSCHDGSQAMDSVINAPGSGLYNSTGAVIGGGAGTTLTGVPVPMLQGDLSDDHPISMQYAAGGPIGTDANGAFGGTLGDPDFNAPVKDTVNGIPIWWVDYGTSGSLTREKSDMILYGRNDLNANYEPFVECGSCHDPHNSSTYDNTAGSQQVAFLRATNAGSAICVACHTK